MAQSSKSQNGNDITYPLKLNSDYYVVTANALVKGKQKMSLREAQLLYVTMSQVIKGDKDFKTYTTTVAELAEFMQIKPQSLYRDLETICTNLLQRVVKIQIQDDEDPKKREWQAFQWISCARYKDGLITIRLNDEIKPFLIDLVSHYSQILLGTLCNFKSYYTIRLYQLIICEQGESPSKPKKEWYFTCDELREFFQIEKDKYSRPSDMVKKTLKVAIDELNASDYAVIWDYEEIKNRTKGNPLVGVRFKATTFTDKSKKDWYLGRYLPMMESLQNSIESNNIKPSPNIKIDNTDI